MFLCWADAASAGAGARRGAAAPPVTSAVGSKPGPAKKPRERPRVEVETSGGNKLTVDDPKGRRLLEANVFRVRGILGTPKGENQPVVFERARCRLFRDGKFHMELSSPLATWDGQHLQTTAGAHAVTADGKSVVDGRRVVWTAKTGLLEATDARYQGMKGAVVDFTAQAPRVVLADRVLNLTSGAKGRNAAGQEVSAGSVRVDLDSGKLEAHGSVRLVGKSSSMTCEHLNSDTKLKKATMTGRPRLTSSRAPFKAPRVGRREKP